MTQRACDILHRYDIHLPSKHLTFAEKGWRVLVSIRLWIASFLIFCKDNLNGASTSQPLVPIKVSAWMDCSKQWCPGRKMSIDVADSTLLVSTRRLITHSSLIWSVYTKCLPQRHVDKVLWRKFLDEFSWLSVRVYNQSSAFSHHALHRRGSYENAEWTSRIVGGDERASHLR